MAAIIATAKRPPYIHIFQHNTQLRNEHGISILRARTVIIQAFYISRFTQDEPTNGGHFVTRETERDRDAKRSRSAHTCTDCCAFVVDADNKGPSSSPDPVSWLKSRSTDKIRKRNPHVKGLPSNQPSCLRWRGYVH